jgi:CHASE3 domain sensor protein
MSNNDSNHVELNLFNSGMDKKSTGEFLDKLQNLNKEERTTFQKSLIAQLEQRDNKVRLQVEDEVKKRVAEFKTQVASGASAKEVLEAQAQAANQVVKGVLLGVGCALVVGLVVLAAANYLSKEDSRAGHVQDNSGSDSDDDWRIAARCTSKERLAFARKKLKDVEF